MMRKKEIRFYARGLFFENQGRESNKNLESSSFLHILKNLIRTNFRTDKTYKTAQLSSGAVGHNFSQRSIRARVNLAARPKMLQRYESVRLFGHYADYFSSTLQPDYFCSTLRLRRLIFDIRFSHTDYFCSTLRLRRLFLLYPSAQTIFALHYSRADYFCSHT